MTDPDRSEAAPKSAFWLAFRVFDEPAQVFRQLSLRPRVLIPLICVVISVGIFAFATPASVMQEQTRDRMEQFQQSGQITSDQLEERVEQAASVGSRALIFGLGTAVGLVGLVIVAAVLMLVFGATTAEPLRFKEELAIVVHANMVSLAGGLLAVGLAIFAGMSQLQFSLGFLVSEESNPFLYRFANQITAFGAWNVLLLALGNKIRTGAKGIGGALAIVGSLWIAVKLVIAVVQGFAPGG